ncbi:PAB-dependent poly(A)-specific ribonuclease subunit PAN3, partial [Leucoagaricus sp. SymC.cos]
ETIHTIVPPSTTSLPDECQSHRSFVPLEQHGRTTERRKLKNWYSTVYRAIKTSDGRPIALCGVENYRLMHQSAFLVIELWNIHHPHTVPVRKVFTIKAFNDVSALDICRAYYPNAQTFYDIYSENTSTTLPSTTTTSTQRPPPRLTNNANTYTRQLQTQPPPDPSQIFPERIPWSYVIQLASTIKSTRTSSSRLRIGTPDVPHYLTEGSLLNHPMLSSTGTGGTGGVNAITQMNNLALMQEDLTIFGRLVFSLACMNGNAWTAPQFQKSLDWMQRWYKQEIKSVALYLISKSSHRIDHLHEMIRPKIQQEMEEAMLATDRLEAESLSELENARLVRLLCKFGFVNERPDTSRSSVDLGTMRRRVNPQEPSRLQAELVKLADLALSELPELPQSSLPSSNVPPTFSSLRDPICLPPSPIPGDEAPTATAPSPSPFSRSAIGLCATKSGDVYVYGGCGDPGTLSRCSTKDNTVTLLQCGGDSPGERCNPAMTIVGSVLALHGGYKSNPWGILVDPSLFLLNLVSRKWSKITAHGDALDNLVGHSMVAVDTTIYIYGGSKYVHRPEDMNSDLWAFNLNTLRTKPSWELVKPCSNTQPSLERDSHKTGILVPYRKGLILIANGFMFPTSLHTPKYLDAFVWTFDLKSKYWSALGRIVGDGPLEPRRLASAVVFDGVVYVVGDYAPPDKRIVEYRVFAFKISERRWSKLDYPLEPRPHNLNLLPLEEKLSQLERENEKLKNSQVILAELQRENKKFKHDRIILANLKQENEDLKRNQTLLLKLERENKEELKRKQIILADLKRENEELKREQIILAELERENKELKCGQIILAKLEKANEKLKHSLGQIIPAILEALLAANMSVSMREVDAQDMVDFLAEVIERQELHQSRTERRRILNLFRRIAKSAQVFPKCTELSGVQCNFAYPMNDEGGYGLIYKGTFNQQVVCVKVVRADGSSTTADAKDSAGELALLAHVSHLNIIPLYGAYFSAEYKRICIVTPWMENGDLAEFLKKSDKASSIQIPLISDIAAGLQYLHDMDVIHADLKAKNVLVSRSQRAILADFGVSTILSTNVGATTARDFAGTNHWMAPELLLGEGPLPPTPQSDMWGFGCICFEVSAGQIPFNGYQPGQVIAALILNPKATPLRPRKNGDPIVADGGPLLILAEECWNRDPSQRPTAAKALQFLSDLNVKDERPSMEEELAMFEAAKSGRPEVKIDYGRILSIIHKVGLNYFSIRTWMTEQ